MNDQEKALIRNVQSHDLAESLRLRRAVHAKTQGLPPEAFSLPFPANQTVIQRDGGLWWKVPLGIASGVIALALPALAVSGLWLLTQRQPMASPPSGSVPAVGPTIGPTTGPVGGFQWQIEYRDREGNWRPVGEPVRIHSQSQEGR